MILYRGMRCHLIVFKTQNRIYMMTAVPTVLHVSDLKVVLIPQPVLNEYGLQ